MENMTAAERQIKEIAYNTTKEILAEAFFMERFPKHHKDNGDKKKNGNEEHANRRAIVINWLKDPKVNKAEIMRELWHPSAEEEDGKRSYFIKCLYGKVNKETGKRYSFTDEDITSLYRIKGNF